VRVSCDDCDPFRPGSGGGTLLRCGRGGVSENPGLFDCGWSLSMGGGGRSGRSLTPRGRLSVCCSAEEPNADIGGLFVVWPREGRGGRFLDVGRGGGGLLLVAGCCCCAFKLFPTPCWFNAAILADSDVNCGSSSTSVIVVGRDQYNCGGPQSLTIGASVRELRLD
jgi:hypothetical protein